MKIRFSVIMALVAFVLSILIGFLAGNYIINILLKAFVFSLLFAALTYGSLDFLEKRVPEFFQLFSGLGAGLSSKSEESDSASGENLSPSENETTGDEKISTVETGQEAELSHSEMQNTPMVKRGLENLGNHILVKDKKIINEPKIMAEAIRTIMSKDNE